MSWSQKPCTRSNRLNRQDKPPKQVALVGEIFVIFKLHLSCLRAMWSFTVESELFEFYLIHAHSSGKQSHFSQKCIINQKSWDYSYSSEKKTEYMTHFSIQPTFFAKRYVNRCKKTPTAGPLHHRAATGMSWTLRLVLLGKMSTEVGRWDWFLVGWFSESSKWAGWLHSLNRTHHLKMDGWNISFLLGRPIILVVLSTLFLP